MGDLGPLELFVIVSFPLSGVLAAIYLSVVLNRAGRRR